MRKVAVYLISDGMGGAEQVVWQSIFGFKESNSIYLIVNNEIASFYADLLPECRFLNIGDIYLHSKKKFRTFRFFLNNRFYSLIPWIIRTKTKKVVEFLSRNEIEILHSHLDYTLYSSLRTKKKITSVKLFHSVHSAFGLTENSSLKSSLPLSRINFCFVDKLIFVSNYIYNLYKIKNIPINEYEIIYNGINFLNKEIYREKVNSNNEFEILYVGGSKYVKGYDILVETIDLLSKSKTEWNFQVIVLGQVSDNSDFFRMIKERGIGHLFRFVGFIPPPKHLNFFKSADMLIMPSRSEVLPLAAIEAISLDLPILASNVGGLSEIVKHNENGLLTNNSPIEYYQYILDLMAGYNTFLKKARSYNQGIMSQFDAKNMCQKLLKIY